MSSCALKVKIVSEAHRWRQARGWLHKEEGRTIFLLFGEVNVQFASNDERPLEIDIADVGDNKLTIAGFAVDNGIFKLEDWPSIGIGGLGRLKNRRLLQIIDVT